MVNLVLLVSMVPSVVARCILKVFLLFLGDPFAGDEDEQRPPGPGLLVPLGTGQRTLLLCWWGHCLLVEQGPGSRTPQDLTAAAIGR